MKITTLACLLLLLSQPVLANNAHNPVRAEPETFQRPPAAAATKAALRLQPGRRAARAASASATGSTSANAVILPALTDSEIQSLRNASNEKAYQVGIGRDLPANFSQPFNLDDWQWTSVSGGRVAHYTLTSTDAVRIRAQVQLSKAPAGVELRFYSPSDTTAVFGPYSAASEPFWSPTVAGDTLGVELFLPDGVAASEVELSIARLSHLVVDPVSGQTKSSIFKDMYSSCQVDIACATPNWQETGKAVARYVFTESTGISYLCSGTLLADKDVYTQTPYFFTAAHCINNQVAASSMNLFWLYANTSCGGSGANSLQTDGGGQLLSTRTELDTALVRLNKTPPSGVTMSGWTTTPLTSNQVVTGIHHPLGQPKKYSQGNFATRASITNESDGYFIVDDPNGDYSKVIWSTGITAPGSSGSGLWVETGGVHYLNGTLLGGGSECAAMNTPDEYSRFELAWPYVSSWLNTTGVPPSLRLIDSGKPASALVEGVIIARYLQGIRGNALLTGVTSQTLDIAILEARLASVVQVMDIDNDGVKDMETDGVLLLRYLLGLRGTPLLQGLDVSTSARNTPTAIAAYIDSILNPAS